MKKTLIVVAACAAWIPLAQAQAQAQTPTEALVERGRYLVETAMNCNGCHTPRGPNGLDVSKKLSGGLTFDEPAFKVTASNITPDIATGIGKWSDDDIKKLFVTGVRPDGETVAPIMPTAFYSVLTPRDLSALVAYLRTIPPVQNQVPAPEYKMKMTPQKAPFVKAQMTEADQIDPVKHGRYLATIAHCLECHTPEGKNGARDLKKIGLGGVTFKGPFGESKSANITRDKTAGLGAWTDDEIKRAITQGISRDGRKLKPPMGFAAYAQLTPQDLSALVSFVRTLPAKK